jgi:NAD(P)-dependent dehydrogenase (short-subunit alcohol dehydrogenase family)
LNPHPDHGEHTYRGSDRLRGCVAVVVGADSGIGRAVALAFAREGADIVIAYADSEQQAEATAGWITDAGHRALLIPGDIRDDDFRDTLLERAVEEFGQLDVLVNNAAFQWAQQSAGALESAGLEEIFRTSAESVLLMAETAARKMQPGGSIINTSAARLDPVPGQQRVYATHGQAIDRLTGNLAQKLAPLGIRVNAISPGPVWTPDVVRALPAQDTRDFGTNTLFGRPLQPAELAPAFVFLASNDAIGITGAVLPVGGGG